MKDPLGAQTLQRAIARADSLQVQVRGLQIQVEGERTRARRILATFAAVVRQQIALNEKRRIESGLGGDPIEDLEIELAKVDEEGEIAALYVQFVDQGKRMRLRMSPFPGQEPAKEVEEKKPPLIILPGGLA